jgi:DNA-binding beta-propeller fold protein YncE
MTHARLTIALIATALLTSACGGGLHHTSSTRSTRTTAAVQKRAQLTVKRDPVLARLGLPPLHGHSPLPGYLMIADRDNNRIIIVSPSKKIVWTFPSPGALKPGQRFAGPDDAFITADGRYITTNEEFSDTVAILSLARHPRIVWQYGHQDVQGSGPGFLAHPDDAYMVSHGQLMVADIINCRVLWLSRARHIVHAIGSAGDRAHDPPRALLAPNGDTPLPDGGVLVTEIGGYVDRFTAAGKLKWSIKTPTNYPSDAQLLANGNVLVAGFNSPGRIDIITPSGHIVWSYERAAGPGELDQPSLAVQLPGGMIAATDDWNHRVVVIDPKRNRIVWQYGHDHVAGTGPGYLNKPDGLDLVP